MSSWPATIPQALFTDGYGEAPPNVTIRSQMDFGPDKVRRRATAGVRPVSGKMVMTSAQLADFKTFYNTTILGGSLRFDWVDPYDGTTAVEMRFSEPPSWTAAEGNYEVSMKLEILP